MQGQSRSGSDGAAGGPDRGNVRRRYPHQHNRARRRRGSAGHSPSQRRADPRPATGRHGAWPVLSALAICRRANVGAGVIPDGPKPLWLTRCQIKRVERCRWPARPRGWPKAGALRAHLGEAGLLPAPVLAGARSGWRAGWPGAEPDTLLPVLAGPVDRRPSPAPTR